MLEKDDLEQIGTLVTGIVTEIAGPEKIREAVTEIIASESTRAMIRDVVVEAVGEALEQIVSPRLYVLETDMSELKTDVASLQKDMVSVKSDIAGMKGDIAGMKSSMVTVDYMDRRLFDQKGELANSGIRASQQVKTLATELHRNGVITVDQFVLATTA